MTDTPLLQKAQLQLAACPHCGVTQPLMQNRFELNTTTHDKLHPRTWALYVCKTCGGCVLTACVDKQTNVVIEQYPSARRVAEEVPERARDYLSSALETLFSPPASVIMAASAVDAMLKAKGLTDGSLYARIDEAARTHLLTAEMAAWAHDVRLGANEQRHADLKAPLPNKVEAAQALEFALALAEYLFVLPARVQRGRRKAGA